MVHKVRNGFYSEKLALLKKKDQEAFDAFTGMLREEKMRKGEKILPINAICRKICVLQSGAVRHFRLDKEGLEFNIWFSFEGEILVAMESFVLQEPSLEGMEVMEDCSYLYISHQELSALAEKYHAIESFHRQLMELYFIEIERRLYRMQTFTAHEKYHYIMNHEPHFLKRISQVHLASFLGITRETLSRIRRTRA